MIIHGLFFYIFSFLLVISSLVVISVRNPVHSVLWLIFCFFNVAGLFILVGAEFLAMTLVIVYVGAVAVLFLFVVMMLNIKIEQIKAGFNKHLPIYILISLVLIADLFLAISKQGDINKITKLPAENFVGLTNTHAIGSVLYTDFMPVLIISGLVLLVAMISAIILTHRNRENVKRQNAGKQFSRSVTDSMEVVKVKVGRGIE